MTVWQAREAMENAVPLWVSIVMPVALVSAAIVFIYVVGKK